MWVSGRGRLSIHERVEILLGIARGKSLTAIARSLGRATSTVTREVAANGGRPDNRAWVAHRQARESAGCPKPFKLVHLPLCDLLLSCPLRRGVTAAAMGRHTCRGAMRAV